MNCYIIMNNFYFLITRHFYLLINFLYNIYQLGNTYFLPFIGLLYHCEHNHIQFLIFLIQLSLMLTNKRHHHLLLKLLHNHTLYNLYIPLQYLAILSINLHYSLLFNFKQMFYEHIIQQEYFYMLQIWFEYSSIYLLKY